jgi:hypothetical protein
MANEYLFNKYKGNNRIFIETGTWQGDGIEKALQLGYEKVYSCDIDEDLVKKSSEKFKDKNVKVLALHSSEALKIFMNEVDEPCTIFLDAHVMPKDQNNESMGFDDRQLSLTSDKGVPKCPLVEELSIISTSDIKNHTILIDDEHCFGTWMFNGLTLDETYNIIKKINPDYMCLVEGGSACFYL